MLITSQSPHWPPGQALEVPVLDTEVAAGFLVNRTGDPDRQAAAELAGELGGLPLALEQAAAYIQATGTTLAGYLALFRHRRADLLARGEAAGHPADVAATLGLALSRLEQRPRPRRGCCGCWRAGPRAGPAGPAAAAAQAAGELGPERGGRARAAAG